MAASHPDQQIVAEIGEGLKAHGAWKARLQSAIATGSSDFDVSTVAEDDKCRFGAWLHGLDSHEDHWRAAHDQHEAFHLEAARILELALTGQRDAAAAASAAGSPFDQISSALTDLLIGWRASVTTQHRRALGPKVALRVKAAALLGLALLTTLGVVLAGPHGPGAVAALACSIAAAALAWVLLADLAQLRRYVALVETAAGGDLTVHADDVGSDELAALARGINQLLDSFEHVSIQLREGAESVHVSTDQVLGAASQSNSSATEQSAAINETTTAVEEIRATAGQAAQNAEQVAEQAESAARGADEGARAVADIVSGMQDISEQVGQIAQDIQTLSDHTAQIGEITGAVNDLADQSNLLALNATIEAARAGDQGKGFAVVADEVRNLAEQSKQATAQVQQILSEIQGATTAAVAGAQRGTSVVDEGVQLAQRAGEIIANLAETSGHASQAAQEIAATAKQQGNAMDQIAQAMTEARQATHEFAEVSAKSQFAAEGLSQLAGRLEQISAGHKL